jgi:hypothetical protein
MDIVVSDVSVVLLGAHFGELNEPPVGLARIKEGRAQACNYLSD